MMVGGWPVCGSSFYTPKINMEPKHEGLVQICSDDVPLQTGDLQVPAVHFPGCTYKKEISTTNIRPLDR